MADEKTRYERLSSLVNEALLNASDDEILESVRAEGVNPEDEAAKLQRRLMATFQTVTQQATAAPPQAKRSPSAEILADPFADVPALRLRQIAKSCNIDTSILKKLCDRLIEAATIPRRLVTAIADELGKETSFLLRFFELPPRVAVSANYKSESTPVAQKKETFSDAVRSSNLDDTQKRAWLMEE